MNNNPPTGPQNPVLLVEDNPLDVDLTVRALQRRRLLNPILIARDGEEALAWQARWEAGEPRPVLILLDLKLPKVDGLDVLRAFKSNPVSRSVPIVVLTTSDAERDVRTAYEFGANSYILKPVDFEKFVQMTGQLEVYWAVMNLAPR